MKKKKRIFILFVLVSISFCLESCTDDDNYYYQKEKSLINKSEMDSIKLNPKLETSSQEKKIDKKDGDPPKDNNN